MLPAKERANSNFIWSSFQHAQITHLVLILPGPDLKTMCPAAAHSAVSYLAAATSAWLSNSRSDPGRCWERRGLAASLSVPADGKGETEAALCRSGWVYPRGWLQGGSGRSTRSRSEAALQRALGRRGHPELARPSPQRDSAWRWFEGDNGGGGGS